MKAFGCLILFVSIANSLTCFKAGEDPCLDTALRNYFETSSEQEACLDEGVFTDCGDDDNWAAYCPFDSCSVTGVGGAGKVVINRAGSGGPWQLGPASLTMSNVTVKSRGAGVWDSPSPSAFLTLVDCVFEDVYYLFTGEGSLSLINVRIELAATTKDPVSVIVAKPSTTFVLQNVFIDMTVGSSTSLLEGESPILFSHVQVKMSSSNAPTIVMSSNSPSIVIEHSTFECSPPVQTASNFLLDTTASVGSLLEISHSNFVGLPFLGYSDIATILTNVTVQESYASGGFVIYDDVSVNGLYVIGGTFNWLIYSMGSVSGGDIEISSVQFGQSVFEGSSAVDVESIILVDTTVGQHVCDAGGDVSITSLTASQIHFDSGGSLCRSNTQLTLFNVSLDSCSGAEALLELTSGQVTVLTITRSVSVGSSVVVVSGAANWVNLVSLTIHDCVGGTAGTLTAMNSASVNVTGASFRNNVALQGGAFFAGTSSFLAVRNFEAVNNTALSAGGACLCVQANCLFYDGIFSDNSAVAGGIVMAVLSPTMLVLDNVLIENPSGGASAFMALLTLGVSISRTRIVSSAGSAVYLGGVTTSSIISSYIVSNATETAAFAVFGSETDLAINNTTIIDFRGWNGEQEPSDTVDVWGEPPALPCVSTLEIDESSLVCAVAARNVACERGCELTPASLCLSLVGAASPVVSSNGCKAVCNRTSKCVGGLEEGPLSTWGAGWGMTEFVVPGCHLCSGLCASGSAACLSQDEGGWCVDEAGGSSYSCTCLSGYEGDGVSSCTNINECELGTDTCLDPAQGGVCTDTVGSFSCSCGPGWTGDGFVCQDINECDSQNLNDCSPLNATCVNTEGSFTCVCQPNLWGSGVECHECPPLTVTYPPNPARDIYDCQCPTAFTRVTPTLCVPCAPGSFLDPSGGCFACGFADVSNTTNSTACYPCPPFSVPSEDHTECECLSTHVAVASLNNRFGFECILQCSPGTVVVDGIDCAECGLGEYSTIYDAVTCEKCPDFETTGQLGSSSPSDCFCRPGYNRSAETGACNRVCEPGTSFRSNFQECFVCPEGFYTSGVSEPSCTPCPSFATTAANHSTSLTQCFCQEGYVLVDAVSGPYGPCTLQCPAGSRPLSSTVCIECSSNTFSSEPTTQASECPPCEPNSASPPNSTSHFDCKCLAGYFTRTPDTEPWLCEPCPVGALCVGSTSPPMAGGGYSAIKGDPYSFAECVPSTSCLVNGSCSEGYEGSFCATCSEGYFRSAGECSPCPRNPLVLFVFMLLLALALSAFMMYWNLQDFASDRFVSLLIGANILQIYGLYGQLGIDWPEFGQAFFNVLSISNFNLELFSPECTVKAGSPFVARWITLMLLPFLFLFVLAIFHGLMSLFIVVVGSRTSLTHRAVSGALFRSFIQFMILSYLPLSSGVMSFFDCVPNGNPGEFVVTAARDQLCYTAQYNRVIGAAVLFTVLYPVGIPLCLYGLLRYKRLKLGSELFALRYAFTVGRYRDGYWVYELSVMIRKLLIVICLFFLSNSAYLRGAGAFVVLVVSLGVHSQLKPYRLILHNVLETICLFTACTLITLAVSFSDGTWSTSMKNSVVALVLLVNLVIIAVCVLWDIFLKNYLNKVEWMAGLKTSFLYDLTEKGGPPELKVTVTLSGQPVDSLQTVTTDSGSAAKDPFASVLAPPPSDPTAPSREGGRGGGGGGGGATYGSSLETTGGESVFPALVTPHGSEGEIIYVPPPPQLASTITADMEPLAGPLPAIVRRPSMSRLPPTSMNQAPVTTSDFGGSELPPPLSSEDSYVLPPPAALRGRSPSNAGGGASAPPPPLTRKPSVSGLNNNIGGGGTGGNVVPPPPPESGSDDTGHGLRGRSPSNAGGGASAPPPPLTRKPSVSGLNNNIGGGGNVVPPPPPESGSDDTGYGLRGRSPSSAGGGASAPPPPLTRKPSVSGLNNNIGGGGGGGGGYVVPPPPPPFVGVDDADFSSLPPPPPPPPLARKPSMSG